MKRILLLLLCVPLLSGCSFVTMERQIYPICMSIDRTEDGRFLVGVQAPRATQGNGASYELIAAQGDDLPSALRTLCASTPYPLNFSQIRLCAVGYPLAAQTELRSLLRVLLELPTMRPNAYVSIAMGSALKVLEKQQPDFGTRLSTHLSLLLTRARQERLLPDSTLSSCVRELSDGRSDPLIGVCAVNTRLLPEEERGQSSSGGSGGGGDSGGGESASAPAFALGEPWSDALLPENVLAGLIPHDSQNPVEYLGAATVSSGRVSGVLTANQTQLVLRLLDEATLRTARSGEGLQLQILLDANSPLAQETEAIGDVVRHLQALGCDALLFGCRCSMGFATQAAWEAYGFRQRYAGADVAVR